MPTTETLTADKALSGFVKIWKTDPTSGESSLVVDKPNLILKGATKIITQALTGDTSHAIWGMYIGYNNQAGFALASAPTIDSNYTTTFAARADANFGYLREPLSFTPNFSTSAGFSQQNTVLFSTMVTSAASVGGAVFNNSSNIYEVALIAAPAASDKLKDVVFSRTNFSPVRYDNTYNFTITWGVRILVA